MAISPREAYQIISQALEGLAGDFYGQPNEMAFGSGLIFGGVKYPQFIENSGLFGTLRGSVYVLSHECDIEQGNDRPFNNDVAILPIIPFTAFVENFLNIEVQEENHVSLLFHLVNRNISRLVYIPPFDTCEYGAVLFFNQIASTKLQCFEEEEASIITSLSEKGRRLLDFQFSNHLFRPTQALPLNRAMTH